MNEAAHRHFVELAHSVPDSKEVLDIPTGSGAIAARMAELEHRVTAGDIAPDGFRAKGLSCVEVDLDSPLPFGNESFDLVLCREGIEHVENTFLTLRSFRRVLRLGGHLLISTPNLLCLRSRFAHFWVGGERLRFRPPRDVWNERGGDHINLRSYYELRAALRRCGFSLVRVTSHARSRTSLALAPLAPLVALLTWRALARERRPDQRQANREIFADVISRDLLFGKKLIILARAEPLASKSHVAARR